MASYKTKTNKMREKITTKDVEDRAHLILRSLVNSSEFEFNILLKQLSNWSPAKRRQTLRLIFIKLFSNIQSFQWEYLNPVLNESGLNWYEVNKDFILIKIIDKFINGIIKLDDNKRFIPEKVYTLPRLSTDLLLIEPRLLKYILENNILVLSPRFTISGSCYSILGDKVGSYRWQSKVFNTTEKIYKVYGIDTNILFNIHKVYLITMQRILDNSKTIFNHTIVKDRVMNTRNIDVYKKLNFIIGRLLTDNELALSKLSGDSAVNWAKSLEDTKKRYPGCVMSEIEFEYIRTILHKRATVETDEMLKFVGPLIGPISKEAPAFIGEAFDPSTTII